MAAKELAKIGVDDSYPLDGKYKITAGLTLSDWVPIGTLAEPFAGIIDENNQTITLQGFDSAAVSSAAYIGVFGKSNDYNGGRSSRGLACGLCGKHRNWRHYPERQLYLWGAETPPPPLDTFPHTCYVTRIGFNGSRVQIPH
jgi:hypothetical protein